MPCVIKIKDNLESSVRSDLSRFNGQPYYTALNAVRDLNRRIGFKVANVYSDYDTGAIIDVDIPEAAVDYYYQNELRIEEAEARQMLMEDAERVGIKEEEFTDRYLFDEATETYDPIEERDRMIVSSLTLTEEAQQQQRDLEVAQKLNQKFQQAFGIKGNIITKNQAKDILLNTETPYTGQAAFYYNNEIYFIEGNFNSTSVLHEYAHPLLKVIQIENPKLFEKLYLDLASTADGQDIITTLKEQDIINEDTDRFKEEAIVRAIELDGVRKLDKIKSDDSAFAKFIKNLLGAIRQAIRKMVKKANLTKFNTDTTVSDLTDMLLSKDFVIDTAIIPASEFAEFREDFEKLLSDAKQLESRDLVQSINLLYSQFNELYRLLNNAPKELADKIRGEDLNTTIQAVKDHLRTSQTLDLNEQDKETFIRAIELNHDKTGEATARSFILGLEEVDLFVERLDEVLRDMKKLGEQNTPEGMARLDFYFQALDGHEEFIDGIRESLNLRKQSALNQKLRDLSGLMRETKQDINVLLYEGVIDRMSSKSDYINSGIVAKLNERVTNALSYIKDPDVEKSKEKFIKNLIERAKKGDIKSYNKSKLEKDLGYIPDNNTVTKRLITDFIPNFFTLYLTKNKLDNVIKGNEGDVRTVGSMVLAYSDINDPTIIFAMDMLDEMSDAANKSQMEYNTIVNKLEPLMQLNNYNPNNTEELRDKLFFEDQAGTFNAETEEFEEYNVWTVINKYKNWRYDYGKLKSDLAKAKANDDVDAQTAAQDALWDFEAKYMHRRYTNEFYDIQKIWSQENVVENPETGKDMTVSRELSIQAYSERYHRLAEVNAFKNTVFDESSQDSDITQLDEAQQAYNELFNLVDNYGNYKTGDELKKTLVRLKYREASRDLREEDKEKTLRNAQRDLNNFTQIYLPRKGITPETNKEEYDKEVSLFLDRNYRVAYSDQYYKELKDINDQIKALTSKGGVSKVAKDIARLYKKMSLQLAVVSKDGVSDGSRLSYNQIKALKETQNQILKLQKEFDSQTGLTKQQLRRFNYLQKVINDPNTNLTQEERVEYGQLAGVIETKGLTKAEGLKLRQLYAAKNSIQNEFPTVQYITIMNNMTASIISDLYDQGIITEDQVNEISLSNADEFINSPLIDTLKENNKEFKAWFNNNHIQKEVWVQPEGSQRGEWQIRNIRLNAWSVKKPKGSQYYAKTTLKDPITKKDFVINAKPGSKYVVTKVKSKYRTLPKEFEEMTIEEQNKYIDKGIIDNKGRFLPREFKEGKANSAYNKKYINEQYEEIMQNPSSARALLLQEFTNQYLKIQQGRDTSVKHYLDQPRFRRKTNLELLKSGQSKQKAQGKWEAFYSAAKSGVWKAADDVEADEQGRYSFNFNPKVHLVQTGFDGEPVSKIPVRGMYKLDSTDVSADVMTGVMDYLFSLNEYDTLRKNEPFAKAFTRALDENPIKDKTATFAKVKAKVARVTGIHELANKSRSTNKRAQLMNYFMNRMFYGQVNSAFQEENPRVTKLFQAMMGSANRAFTALDVASATKNKTGMEFQMALESIASPDMTVSSFAKGKIRAYKTMVELSAPGGDIYNRGTKSLNVQLVDAFDAKIDQVRRDFGKAQSRTFTKDFLDATWMYDFRRWSENQASIQIFWAMMETKLIKQTLPGGKTKQIPYGDAWKLDSEGQIRLLEGVSPDYFMKPISHVISKDQSLKSIAKDYGTTEERLNELNKVAIKRGLKVGDEIKISDAKEFKAMKRKVLGMNKKLNGMLVKFDSPQATQHLAYNFFTFYRKFAMPMFMNRFQFSMNDENKYGDVYDWNAGGTKKGYYIDALQGMYRLLKDYNANKALMTQDERNAITKTLGEAAFLMVLGLATAWIFGFDEEDEDRYQKLRDRQETTTGWISNYALYILMMTKKENELFNPVFGFDDQIDLVKNTSIATGPTIELYAKFIGHLIGAAQGDESAVYKRDAGPYSWQKKGQAKWKNDLGSMFGIKGKNYDPAQTIQKVRRSWTGSK